MNKFLQLFFNNICKIMFFIVLKENNNLKKLTGDFKLFLTCHAIKHYSVTMDDIVHNILVTGIVLDRLLELRDPEGNDVIPKVKFPPTYYGEDSTFDATLVNLTSDTLAFSMAFLDDEHDDGDDDGDNFEDAVSDGGTSNEQEEGIACF